MTAQVLLHPTAGAIADETVRRAIKALIAARGVDKDELARGVGMNRATLYRRLAGQGSSQAFSAGEVALIATYFGVPIGDVFTGLGGAVAASEGDVTPPVETKPKRTRGVTVNTRWSPRILEWRPPVFLPGVA